MSRRLDLNITDVMKATDRKRRVINNGSSNLHSSFSSEKGPVGFSPFRSSSERSSDKNKKRRQRQESSSAQDFVSTREDVPAFVSRLNVAEKLMGPYEQNPLEHKLKSMTREERILKEKMPDKPTWATRRDVQHRRFEKRKKLKIRLRGLEDRIDSWLDPKW